MTRKSEWMPMVILVLIGAMATCVQAHAVEICWTNPSFNVDGTSIDDLDKITLFWGDTQGGPYPNEQEYPTTDPGGSLCRDLELPPGSYYLVATATDGDGNESVFSNEVVKVEDGGPDVPVVLALDGEIRSVDVRVGVTGEDAIISWQGEQTLEFRVIRVGGTTPVAQAEITGTSWTFTPDRAGLFELDVRSEGGEWSESGYMFYFELAAPTDGDIE